MSFVSNNGKYELSLLVRFLHVLLQMGVVVGIIIYEFSFICSLNLKFFNAFDEDV